MADFFAQDAVDSFVPVYMRGLRDIRNRSLSPYYAETPRSLPSSDDVTSRYASIVSAAAGALSDITAAMPINEWLAMFPPVEGQKLFITFLQRSGLELVFKEDLETDETDQLALRGAELIDLSIQQRVRGKTFSIAYIQDILDRSVGLESLTVLETDHFVEDEQENDAFDADRKAFERAKQVTAFVEDLLGELS